MNFSSDLVAVASRIRLFALDVDGTLTDGTLYYGSEGEALKAFHVHDGLGLRLLMEEGIEVAVVTARRSEIVERRLRDLGVARIFVGRDDHPRVLEDLGAVPEIDASTIAFMGDDVLARPALRHSGLSIAPADAHPLVLREVACVTERRGGRGAVREAVDAILRARGRLDDAVAALLAKHVGSGRHGDV
jgi:3-deoxy-D-manno-octulosonate 8-phosphate phosphatase (KDO 8-P phosphatase)